MTIAEADSGELVIVGMVRERDAAIVKDIRHITANGLARGEELFNSI